MSLRVVIAGNAVSCLGITSLLADKPSAFFPSCLQPGCCAVQGTRGVHSAGEHFSGRR